MRRDFRRVLRRSGVDLLFLGDEFSLAVVLFFGGVFCFGVAGWVLRTPERWFFFCFFAKNI